MNWAVTEDNWQQFKGYVKEQWGKRTDNQFDVIGGKRCQLVERVQEIYAISKEEVERQMCTLDDRYRDWNPDTVTNNPTDRGRPNQARA